MTTPMYRVSALFAGIGGIELGLHQSLGGDMEALMFCESWSAAQRVLAARFPDVDVHPDVRSLGGLPTETTLVTAGFPCTDLSQAGRTAGISGINSGLVSHVFEVLRQAKRGGQLPSLMIENVPNMLVLDRGEAMAYLVDEMEALGYRWAYRVVDSRFTGLPQRRRRVILLASTTFDPRDVLFRDDAGERPDSDYAEDAFGFYWTEGRGGLGWARDAVPTLKGGSALGIPSPPAIWVPGADLDLRFVRPSVEDGEALQGFDRGWTDVEPEQGRRNNPRWKLVGNAVTVRVAAWVGRSLLADGLTEREYAPIAARTGAWPTAAWGDSGHAWAVPGLSEFPEHQPYTHLNSIIDLCSAEPLSTRALAGFARRLREGNLGRYPGFRRDLGVVESHRQRVAAVA